MSNWFEETSSRTNDIWSSGSLAMSVSTITRGFGHIRIDAGGERREGRRVGDAAARPAAAGPAGGPQRPHRAPRRPSSAPAPIRFGAPISNGGTLQLGLDCLSRQMRLTSSGAAGRLRPRRMNTKAGINMQGQADVSVLERAQAHPPHQPAHGAPARAWAIRAATCRAPTSSRCCIFASCASSPQAPRDPDRDRFVLSKGHASAALYATLAERRVLSAAASSTPTCSRCRS